MTSEIQQRGWFVSNNVCYQGCPNNNQQRESDQNRCKCGGNTGWKCNPPFICKDNICV